MSCRYFVEKEAMCCRLDPRAECFDSPTTKEMPSLVETMREYEPHLLKPDSLVQLLARHLKRRRRLVCHMMMMMMMMSYFYGSCAGTV